jgi:hypothetical protein
LKQLEASLFRKINTTERFFSAYFRVGFYGKGFGPSLANRAFIYRGYELERIADFTARIAAKYPQAQLVNTTEMPSADVQKNEGQCTFTHHSLSLSLLSAHIFLRQSCKSTR